MSEQTDSTQDEPAQDDQTQSQSTPTTPAEIITKILVETRDSVETEDAIADRIIDALAEQGIQVSEPGTPASA